MSKFFIRRPPDSFSDEEKDFLMQLQQDIVDALNILEPDQLIMPVHNSAPDKRQSDGVEVIAADGTNWNPGSGGGLYEDDGSTYTKL